MTGDCQSDWVLRAGLSDRSQRFGAAHTAGELRVGEGFSERNRAKRIPNTALEWRAANVEVKVERIARHSDELQNLGQVSAKSAVVRDNPAPREASSQILLHLFGRRAKPNCANADWAARDKNFPKGAVADLMNPLISDGPINASKRRDFEQHSPEAFDQRPQAGLWHHWYEVVEHGALTKQRMGALF